VFHIPGSLLYFGADFGVQDTGRDAWINREDWIKKMVFASGVAENIRIPTFFRRK
jgi:hypothetical protein